MKIIDTDNDPNSKLWKLYNGEVNADGSVMDINFISLVIEIVELWDFKCII